MNQTDSKVSSVSDSSHGSLLERLSALSEMLKTISHNLVESNSAARAHAIVQTCINLNHINYQVMNDVVQEIIQTDACNIFPTAKETPLPHETIKSAMNLANDILLDLPLDIVLLPEKANEHYEFTGIITNMRKVMTRRMDIMAILTVQRIDTGDVITIVAFPRTFDKYRQLLESRHENNHPTVLHCDQYDEETNQYILSHPDVPPAPFGDETQPLPQIEDDGLPVTYRAVYVDEEPGLFEDDLRWQAQWYSGTTYHKDGYERCSFYATEEEAIEAAKRAKANSDLMASLFEKGADDAS